MRYIFWIVILFGVTIHHAHADSITNNINKVCESHVSIIYDWASEKSNTNKKSQQQKLDDYFSSNFNNNSQTQLIAKEVKDALTIALDKIYQKDFPSIQSLDYLVYLDALEQDTQADCIKRLTALTNRLKQEQLNKTNNGVQVDAKCFNSFGCYARVSVENTNPHQHGSYIHNFSSHAYIAGNNIAGRYRYHISFDDKKAQYCTGSFDVYAGNKQITLHINKNNCNLNNIHRYP